MQSFKQYYLEENLLKAILPKQVYHSLKRLSHKDRYKKAVKYYHQFKKEIKKEGEGNWLKKRGFAGSRGAIAGGGADKVAFNTAAKIANLSPREFKKVLDKSTRYA